MVGVGRRAPSSGALPVSERTPATPRGLAVINCQLPFPKGQELETGAVVTRYHEHIYLKRPPRLSSVDTLNSHAGLSRVMVSQGPPPVGRSDWSRGSEGVGGQPTYGQRGHVSAAAEVNCD